jgi:hypothetical protein
LRGKRVRFFHTSVICTRARRKREGAPVGPQLAGIPICAASGCLFERIVEAVGPRVMRFSRCQRASAPPARGRVGGVPEHVYIYRKEEVVARGVFERERRKDVAVLAFLAKAVPGDESPGVVNRPYGTGTESPRTHPANDQRRGSDLRLAHQERTYAASEALSCLRHNDSGAVVATREGRFGMP